MARKILIAIDNCADSMAAVRYAARMTSASRHFSYTLFDVQPPVPSTFREAAEADPMVRAEVDKLVEEHAEATRCITMELKEAMVREGVPEKRVEMVTEPMQLGMARDILSRAEQGQYDAIVLARKALTPARDYFIGTTAAKIVEHAVQVPVWVTSGNVISKKVMIAVDGSENSARCVDHVIDMAGVCPDLRVTLFHVWPHLRHFYSVEFKRKNAHLQQVLQRGDNTRMAAFYAKAYKKLEAAGLKQDHINVEANAQSFDIATAIFIELRTGRYGTVVVGRRGERDAFFTGGIAMRLAQKVTNQALWMVP
ncbi:MAG: universal stress protein [Deltaproteobacteria bacterium]|nr:universal stress protein [Deltaproteobacteria bacterium]